MIANRRGFTLIELAVGLVIIAMLAGVVVPQVVARLTSGQTASMGASLQSVQTAIINYRTDVGRYPRLLSYLTTAPTGSSVDTCNRTLPTASVNAWRGPYLNRTLTTAGLRTSSGLIQDSIRRNPTTYSTTGTIRLTASTVDIEVVDELEANYDAAVDSAAGAIQYAVSTGGQRTLNYYIPIRGC